MKPPVLFGSRLSPFVEKVARALGLKRLPFEEAALRSPLDLKRWNPKTGKMPVLEIDGERVWDSTFILRRLDEIRPDPPLFAADPHTRARQRMLEDWSDESLYWHVFALRWMPAHAPATLDQLAATLPPLARPVARLLFPRMIGSMPRVQGMGRLPLEVLVRELAQRLDDLVVLLADRPFFYGDAPSAADLAVFGNLHTGLSGPTPEVERLLGERPTLAAHYRRVDERTRG